MQREPRHVHEGLVTIEGKAQSTATVSEKLVEHDWTAHGMSSDWSKHRNRGHSKGAARSDKHSK